MYDKMLFYNDNIPYLFHSNILEYDMNAASLSLSERFGLLPKETIERLKRLPKQQRVIETGLIRRNDKEFSVTVDKKLLEVREQFINENNITPEEIISLHSDAIIFASRKKIKNNIDGIQFKEAMRCTGYINYKRIEMFYNDGYIEYKGAVQQLIDQQRMGINLYLIKIFKYIENYDTQILKYMSRFQRDYLMDQLQEYVYQSFGHLGDFKYANLELFAYIANIVVQEMKRW